MLIEAAIDFAASEARPSQEVRMRIVVHPDNILVMTLYGALGFIEAGRATLAEAYRCNEEENLLPADGGASNPEKYHSRGGIVMEKVTTSKM